MERGDLVHPRRQIREHLRAIGGVRRLDLIQEMLQIVDKRVKPETESVSSAATKGTAVSKKGQTSPLFPARDLISAESWLLSTASCPGCETAWFRFSGSEKAVPETGGWAR
eukprot:2388651-Rhodomonas_salina.1